MRPGRAAQMADSVVTVRAEFTVGDDGRTGKLSVAAEIRRGYHIYATTQAKPFIATRIDLDPTDRFKLSAPFKVSQCRTFNGIRRSMSNLSNTKGERPGRLHCNLRPACNLAR